MADNLDGVLKRVRLFSGLSESDYAALAASFTIRNYKRHEVIVREGDTADTFYVVVNGLVGVTVGNEDGKETILSILKPGEAFGEMGILNGTPRSATVMALLNTRVYAMARDKFLALLSARPQLSATIISTLSERLCATNQAMQATAYLTVDARLADMLVVLSQEFGERVEGGTKITLRLTNQQVANMIGTTRETLNRTLNKFWDEHLIDMRTGNIVIPDSSTLVHQAA